MKITFRAKKYIDSIKKTELTLFETSVQTCCSTKMVPRIAIGNVEIGNEKMIAKEMDGMTIHVAENAEKYWQDGMIDLTQFGDIKSLMLKTLNSNQKSCC